MWASKCGKKLCTASKKKNDKNKSVNWSTQQKVHIHTYLHTYVHMGKVTAAETVRAKAVGENPITMQKQNLNESERKEK